MAVSSLMLTNAWRTARKSSPPAELNAPGTFSQTAKVGYSPSVFSLISLIIRMASMNKPLRVISSSPSAVCLRPSRLPACDKDWHGEPNVIISTGSISAPFILDTSPRCFIFGNRLRVTAIGNGSISEAQTGSMPLCCAANSNPPEPENKLPSLKLHIDKPHTSCVPSGSVRTFRSLGITNPCRRSGFA